MKVALMQPYFFPYLGYFQLVAAADVFVLYGDAQYITRGYVNRNRLLIAGQAKWFTVPVESGGSRLAIDECRVSTDGFAKWRTKWLRTLQQAYGKAPQYQPVLALCEAVTRQVPDTIGELASRSVEAVTRYLELDTQLVQSADLSYDRAADAADKIIEIAKGLQASQYINAAGGRHLYSEAQFVPHDIDLKFIDGRLPEYPQVGSAGDEFVARLSMLDLLFALPPQEVHSYLNDYTLVDD